jgi:uncharacterized protein YkuJ
MKKLVLALLIGTALNISAAPNTITLNQFDATSQIVKVDKRDVAYFSGDEETMSYSETPVADGFVRKLLGLTKDGRPVVQDFWAENGQKQIDAVVLNSMEDITDPDSENIDGWVTFYTKDGKRSSRAFVKDGLMQGLSMTYYPSGQLFTQSVMKDDEISETTYYYTSGKKAAHVSYYDGEYSSRSAWTEKGKEVYEEDEIDAVLEEIYAVYEPEDEEYASEAE